MNHQEKLESFIGRMLVSNTGDKIGRISDIYLDDETGEPEWLAVHTGFFGTRLNFVPMHGANVKGDEISVSFDAAQVKAAPQSEADGSLSQEEEAQLYSHYNVQYSESRSDSGLPGGQGTESTEGREAVGRDTSGPTTDSAMTRSEEEMVVSKGQKEAGGARLRKYLVTEERTVTVPVSREEMRIEREPIGPDNYDAAMSGKELSEEEHEVVLSEEQVSVDKKVVPKERVRLGKDTVVEDKSVSADLSKEQIELDQEDSARS